jgi:hypothetical protein
VCGLPGGQAFKETIDELASLCCSHGILDGNPPSESDAAFFEDLVSALVCDVTLVVRWIVNLDYPRPATVRDEEFGLPSIATVPYRRQRNDEDRALGLVRSRVTAWLETRGFSVCGMARTYAICLCVNPPMTCSSAHLIGSVMLSP